jgi:hypothetical protein
MRDVACPALLLAVDVAEAIWSMEIEDMLSEVRPYHRASAGGFRLRASADLSLFTARFCGLSIACVLGVQNRSVVLGSWSAVRREPLACVVSSGWHLDWRRARRPGPDGGTTWFRSSVGVAAAPVARGLMVTPPSGWIRR